MSITLPSKYIIAKTQRGAGVEYVNLPVSFQSSWVKSVDILTIMRCSDFKQIFQMSALMQD